MNFDFRGKTILVTGASRGIGKCIAQMFLRNNGRVIVTYNNTLEIFSCFTCENSIIIKLDLDEEDCINKFIYKLKDLGIKKIDILINNAGVTDINPLIFQEESQILRIININFINTVLLTRALLKEYIFENGCIINISSIWARVGASCEAVYSATKGAMESFTKSLSKELLYRGIKVLGISPGFIKTDINKDLSYDDLDELLKEIPLERFGETKDICDAIMFFSSDYSNLNGIIVNIDGGWKI